MPCYILALPTGPGLNTESAAFRTRWIVAEGGAVYTALKLSTTLKQQAHAGHHVSGIVAQIRLHDGRVDADGEFGFVANTLNALLHGVALFLLHQVLPDP